MFGTRDVRETIERIVKDAMRDAESALATTGALVKVREELETLRIEKRGTP